MNTDQAQSAVTLSAFVVAAVFAYRKLTETATSSTSVPKTAHFVLGFGVVYIALSLVAQAAPAFGGMFAVLVATGDLLTNGQALVNDLTGALKSTATGTAATASPAAANVAEASMPSSNANPGSTPLAIVPLAGHNPAFTGIG